MTPRPMSADEIFGPARVDPLVKDGLTDASHAQRFAEAYGLELKYHHRLDMWLVYDDPCWRTDTDGGVYRMALDFVRCRQAAALEIVDRKAKERTLKFLLNAESKPNLDRLVSLARNLPPMTDAGDGWDTDPWVTGAPNGVVDWRQGRLLPGDPAHRITKALAVPFNPSAEAPRWEQFIAEVCDGDVDLIGFLHRFLGYACTGITREQALALFWGSGQNGKGVLMHVLGWVLGDYFANMAFTTIELKQRSSIPSDLAALEGKRLVTASESGEVRLNEPRIKALTGCDPVTARHLYGPPFTFTPMAKFVLATNTKPIVADNSHGFWRRLKLVPFTRCFEGSARDPNLEDYLKNHEGPGILRWLVDGCLAWGRADQQARPQADWVRVPVPTLRLVSDEVWERAHARLTATREAYLQTTGGRSWGRPLDGAAHKYLLTGLARCGLCGGSLEVRSRSHGKQRAHFYACSSYWRRGKSVCANKAELPLPAADDAVIAALQQELLTPALVDAVVRKVLVRTLPAGALLEETRAKMTAQLAAVATELQNLVEGLAKSGSSQTVTDAIRKREIQKAQLEHDLASLDRREDVSRLEIRRLEALARTKATEWRSVLKRHTPQARQILSKMLRDKLVFRPEQRGTRRGWRFTGEATICELLTGLIPEFSQAVASPTGFEPVFWP